MESARRPATYLVPLFAILWLAMIVASELAPTVYSVDAVFSRDADPRVMSVSPAAERAGLRSGDVMLVTKMPFAQSLRAQRGERNAHVPILIRRGDLVRTVIVPLTKPRAGKAAFGQRLTGLLAVAISLLLTAYLGFRKPSAMLVALILFIGGGYMSWPSFVILFARLPDVLYAPFATVLADICNWFPVMALASFVVRLPGSEPSAAQRLAIRITDAIVISAFVLGFFPESPLMYIACTSISAVVVLLASIAALRFARAADQGRVGIVVAGVMVGGVGYAVNMVGLRMGEPFWLFSIYAELSVLAVSGTLAYAILRHRIFDVAFVLNRTIVYAVTSALILLVFAALEFGAERFLSDVTHVEGIALQFGIALAVIVSVRLVHGRVDSAVDGLLFRARHEQESALRRFAATLQFYTDDAPLIRDTVDAMLRYARVQGAAVYLAVDRGLRQARSSFAIAADVVDENDTAFVELRAHHDVLLVHQTPTVLPGDRLYPMVLAGRIVGVIATGERESHEEMPPDIDEAIRRVAQAVGIALAAIETDRVRAENAVLQARLATV